MRVGGDLRPRRGRLTIACKLGGVTRRAQLLRKPDIMLVCAGLDNLRRVVSGTSGLAA